MLVDWITLSLGIVILGGVACCLLRTEEPLAKKWPVALELEMAYFTALHHFGVSKMVATIGSSCKLFTCTMLFHAFDRVGTEIGGWVMMCTMEVTAEILMS